MRGFWKNRKVFVTGHTGFKGSWLCILLARLGAKVTGYSLGPPTRPSLFELAGVGGLASSVTGDVRDYDGLLESMTRAEPEVIMHMAAQPIVLEGYARPLETFSTNVMGTTNIMEAARHCASARALLNVTTDKCYENNEGGAGKIFREEDRLGGRDPYSASKACSEMVTAALRESFFSGPSDAAVATARAGNVIGGGDWAPDRLLPDFFRAVERGGSFSVRNPDFVRPWQHVLDALGAYLLVAEALLTRGREAAGPWNIGPDRGDFVTVRSVVEKIARHWPSVRIEMPDPAGALREAPFLALDNSKIKKELSWAPRWGADRAVEETAAWFRDHLSGIPARDICERQIENFYKGGL